MKSLLFSGVLIVVFSLNAFAQFGGGGPTDDHNDTATVQSGYVVVTPISAIPNQIYAVETFGLKRGDETFQTSQPVAGLTTSVTMFIDVSERIDRDFGIAVVNPGSAAAAITLTLKAADGSPLGTSRNITVEARRHSVNFISRLFPIPITGAGFGGNGIVQEYTGTLQVTSNSPVAVVGIRFRGNIFSMVAPVKLIPTVEVPIIATGVGGAGSILIPQFVANGGWVTEMVIGNNTTADVRVRVDIFNSDGSPLTTKLNNQSGSSFRDLVVPVNGVLVLSPRDANGDSRF